MNILFISRNSPFESIGGIERYITNLIVYFRSLPNTDFHLYLMLPTIVEKQAQVEKNITIYFEKSLYLPRSILATNKEVSKKAQEFLESVIKVVLEKNIDIICAENFHTDLPPAYSLLLNMLTISRKIPLVLQLHSFAATELQTELLNQLKWDKISCVSKSVAGDCFQKGINIEFISTHYLGVNRKEFNEIQPSAFELRKRLILADTDKIILAATRIIRGKRNIISEKGIINLIQAFSKLSPRYSNWKLLIAIGKPPENLNDEFNIAYEMLQGYIRLHNIQDQTILKMFKLNEMPSVYKGSDLFVLPSENETFGQVFIEAMSSGVPVIGTKVGGIPEIITDSYNGYLVTPDDASALAQRIEKLMNDKVLRQKFIKAGIKTVKSMFTSEKQLKEFVKMLENTIIETQQNF